MERKAVIALALLALLAGVAWKVMDPGKPRLVVFVVLGGFALRVLLALRTSR